ncbi:MAG: NUDIX hydrolase [Woeseiaceae bacterium]|nr:NUDIX hydrolase [Woeseiaceae bacterium]
MIACPASVVATGDYAPGAIAIRRVDLPPLTSEVEDFVEAKWRREVKLNPRLYAGAILSPAAIHISTDRIEIDCGVSDYRQFMGTTWPEVPEPLRRRALGQLAVIVTSDERLVVGVRSKDIDWGGLRAVIPGGRVQPDEGTPEEAILIEFREEAGIGPDEIESLRCVGVLEDRTSGRQNYEIVYLARIGCSASELVDRASSAEHSFEHDRIEVYAWEQGTIADLLSSDPRRFTPSGFGGIALALRHAFGADAFPEWQSEPVTYEEYMGAPASL